MLKAIKHFFGLRKLKSVIALIICFILWQGIRLILPQLEVIPVYAFFYAIFEMRNSLELGKIAAISRIKATITGFVIAFIAIAVRNALMPIPFVQSYGYILELLLILVGVLISLNIAEAINCTTLCAIAATTFIVCFLHTDYNPYLYAFLRFVQTLIGVGVALGVNNFIFKPKTD